MKAQKIDRNHEIAIIALDYVKRHPEESLAEAFKLAELVYDHLSAAKAPVNVPAAQETARKAKPARKSGKKVAKTREEALTIAYGDAEQRKTNVSKMKSCYEQSWSNWTIFRDSRKADLKRSEVKACNREVAKLATKAGYAGEVLEEAFFEKLLKGAGVI